MYSVSINKHGVFFADLDIVGRHMRDFHGLRLREGFSTPDWPTFERELKANLGKVQDYEKKVSASPAET